MADPDESALERGRQGLVGLKLFNAQRRAERLEVSNADLRRQKQGAFAAVRFLARQLMAAGDPRREHEIVLWAVRKGQGH